MPEVGIFVSFFRRVGRSFVLKSCPRGRVFDGKKLVARVSMGGMVTSQIDTCITYKLTKIYENNDPSAKEVNLMKNLISVSGMVVGKKYFENSKDIKDIK